MSNPLDRNSRKIWAILCLALKKFFRIEGMLAAAAFSHYAFFALFPLIVLFVTIASVFIDRNRAGMQIIAYVETYVPISNAMQSYIFDTIAGVAKARGQAATVACVMLVWAAMQFFTTLIYITNLAWGAEAFNWWRLPLKSLVFLAIMVIAVLLGIAMPVLVKMTKEWLFPVNELHSWVYAMGSFVIPMVVVFLSLTLFYRLAPRKPTQFAQVWVAALFTTALLQAAENLFLIYLRNFATLNAIYGAFGGTMALLLWIYLSGCIFIFGACLCAAQAEERSARTNAMIAG